MAIEILTGLLVLITAFYAWSTYKILQANENVVNEMQRQSEEISRPRISIYAHTLPSRPIFHLTIKNMGVSSASNLRLTLDRPFHLFGKIDAGANLAEMEAFTRSISNFAPGEQMDFQLGPTFELLNEADNQLTPPTFKISAEYDFGGRTYKEVTTIDLAVQQMTSLTTDAIVEQLDRVNRTLEKLARLGP